MALGVDRYAHAGSTASIVAAEGSSVSCRSSRLGSFDLPPSRARRWRSRRAPRILARARASSEGLPGRLRSFQVLPSHGAEISPFSHPARCASTSFGPKTIVRQSASHADENVGQIGSPFRAKLGSKVGRKRRGSLVEDQSRQPLSQPHIAGGIACRQPARRLDQADRVVGTSNTALVRCKARCQLPRVSS